MACRLAENDVFNLNSTKKFQQDSNKPPAVSSVVMGTKGYPSMPPHPKKQLLRPYLIVCAAGGMGGGVLLDFNDVAFRGHVFFF